LEIRTKLAPLAAGVRALPTALEDAYGRLGISADPNVTGRYATAKAPPG
jgi:hypothetical protein